MKSTGLICDPIFEKHLTGRSHPECPERLFTCRDALKAEGLLAECQLINPIAATIDQLLLNHSQEYITNLEKLCQLAGKDIRSQSDTDYCKNTFEVAKLASGSTIAALELLTKQKCNNAFVLCRPPGHHAEYDRTMGFCFFNNIAIAASYAIKHLCFNKVFILDWDVHHGNGTQNSFFDNPNVFFCSLHSDPSSFYPGTGFVNETGVDSASGTTLNIPMPAFSTEKDYLNQFDQKVLPAIDSFKPELILISAGFDAHKDDPLGNQRLTEQSFAKFTKLVNAAANQYCNGKLLSVLEGGYNLKALARSVVGHVAVLVDGG